MSVQTEPRLLTRSQLAALSAIPHQQAELSWQAEIPASEYLAPERFEQEKERLFMQAPVLAALSMQLPEPASYLGCELLGIPVLLTRTRDGTVRAFLNVCRHRGTLLAPGTEPARGGRIVCPYHAWTYDLEGQLVGVPNPEAFPRLDRAAHTLVPLPCKEAGGLIWIGLRADAPVDFAEVEGDLADELDALGLGEMSIYRQQRYPLRANWKLVMDTMLDKYHVLRLHKNTLAKYFDDAPEVSDLVGPHIRSLAGRINFDQQDAGSRFEDVRATTVFGYTLFPNGMIVTSPLYVSFLILRPQDARTCAVDYFMLTTRAVAEGDYADKLQRSWDLMDRAFGQEDFWAAELGQRGLETGALRTLVVGGLERRIKQFHDLVNSRIGMSG